MEQKIELAILYDRNVKKITYRTLAVKYGISRTQIHRMVLSKQEKKEKPVTIKPVESEEIVLPDDIKTLKEKLRQALLKIELQDFMLDISSKELGIDLRKKHGTRQSVTS